MVDVSVVVATWNRAHRLPRLFEALASQEDAPPFELVVVDDGSSDDTPATLAALAAAASFPVQVVRLDRNSGPAVARNVGWRRGTGDVVVFTDDDCWADPGWIAALMRGLEKAEVVQGRTVADPSVPSWGWLDHTVEVFEERGFYETCNIAYQRRHLELAGGFDETFRSGSNRGGPIFGEDTDLGWRIRKLGAATVFCADAVVNHEVRSDTFMDRMRSLRRREGIVMVVRRHPEMRGAFGGGWWYQKTHGPAVTALVGAALILSGPRHPLRWLLAMPFAYPYLSVRARGMSNAQRVVLLPQTYAFDLGEVAVLAWASVKHRTLVL